MNKYWYVIEGDGSEWLYFGKLPPERVDYTDSKSYYWESQEEDINGDWYERGDLELEDIFRGLSELVKSKGLDATIKAIPIKIEVSVCPE